MLVTSMSKLFAIDYCLSTTQESGAHMVTNQNMQHIYGSHHGYMACVTLLECHK